MYRTYIAKKRSELGISREKLCEGICNISTLYRFENNKCDISVEIFMKLCKKLKLPYID
ncbi:helix-turn-helix domain-containing protein, partial [Mammaliicoccus sciuri]|uniref:helix-turn-helix domain-containing protein n=1 Tax=Mammaliicoccus sciuri TaxID=1296 RepID=UPI000D47E6B3